MALVGQMLIQGYGCKRDLAAGRDWVARALDTAKVGAAGEAGGGAEGGL